MPILCEFDTMSDHHWALPKPDTQTTLYFPRAFISHPRIAHGLRLLDLSRGANIRVKSTIENVTKSSAGCHITTWAGSIVFQGIVNVLALGTGDSDILTGEHMRNLWVNPDDPASVRINFERPFSTPPKVAVFFNYIDLQYDRDWRLVTTATDIDVNGFTLSIETWGDSILHTAQACWIVYPSDSDHIFSTSVNTTDLPPWKRAEREESKFITFDTVKFWKKPSVFVALNSFDIECSDNLRVNAYVDQVSKTGLVCHIDSWGDTLLSYAGVSIIAFN